MDGNVARLAGGLSALSLFALALPDSDALAQLSDVSWSEAASVHADLVTDSKSGDNPGAPEPLSSSLTGAGYSLDAEVSFASPGPPNATASVDASYQSGLTNLGGTGYCRIDFEFQVRQNVAPPVAVTTVPVSVHAQGTVSATGSVSFIVAASSSFNLATLSGPFVAWEVTADNQAGGSPGSDAFDNIQSYSLAPGVAVQGDMTASANIAVEVLQSGTTASVTAYVDPVIEVADAIIPGTSSSYRDYFDIEFAPGYYALGQAPVEPTTWGKIKQLYGN